MITLTWQLARRKLRHHCFFASLYFFKRATDNSWMKDFVEHLVNSEHSETLQRLAKSKQLIPPVLFCLQVIEDLERECHSLELRHGHAREEVPLPCGFMNRFNLDNQWSGSKRVLYGWIFLFPTWSASACYISCSRQKKLLDLGWELFFSCETFLKDPPNLFWTAQNQSQRRYPGFHGTWSLVLQLDLNPKPGYQSPPGFWGVL